MAWVHWTESGRQERRLGMAVEYKLSRITVEAELFVIMMISRNWLRCHINLYLSNKEWDIVVLKRFKFICNKNPEFLVRKSFAENRHEFIYVKFLEIISLDVVIVSVNWDRLYNIPRILLQVQCLLEFRDTSISKIFP